MRRKASNLGQPPITRSGVTASVTSSKRNPQMPSVSWIFSTGFAPSEVGCQPAMPPVCKAMMAATSQAAGSRHSRNTSGFAIRRTRKSAFMAR